MPVSSRERNNRRGLAWAVNLLLGAFYAYERAQAVPDRVTHVLDEPEQRESGPDWVVGGLPSVSSPPTEPQQQVERREDKDKPHLR